MGFISSSNRRGLGNKINSKFGSHPLSDYFLKSASQWGANQLDRLGHRAWHSINSKARSMTKDFVTGTGVKIGLLDNGTDSYVCGSHTEFSYKHTGSTTYQSPTSDSRIYKTTFQTGVPTSRSLYNFSKNKLVDSKSLVDTERDYLSTVKRQSLTTTFGFNQRSYDFFLKDTFMSVQDYKFLFRSHQDKFESKLANKNIYGNIFYERLRFRIKSETDYYTVQLKLHLVKVTNPSITVRELMMNTFNRKPESSVFSVPIDRQLSSSIIDHHNYRSNILTDLKCTLGSSDYFKDNAKVVRTFYRNLAPNDIWQFDYYFHYGPGILLNRIFESSDLKKYRFPYAADGHPVGYFFILQAEGDPRCSITRTSDGMNFNGSGPGRFNVNFSKELKFVTDPENAKEVLTVREFINKDEDFMDPEFQSYFTPDRQDKVNVDWSSLNVNRVVDNDQPYQVRYGEGRLTVYLDPSIINGLNKFKLDDFEGEVSTDSTDTNSTDTSSNVLDPDAEDSMPSDDETKRLRGSDPIKDD